MWRQQISGKVSKTVLGRNGYQQVMAMMAVCHIIYFSIGRRKKVNGLSFFKLSKGKAKKKKKPQITEEN